MAKTGRAVKSKKTFGIQAAESVGDEIRAMREAIMRRAYEIWVDRGPAAGRAIEDWLAAERELTWRPAIEVTEQDGTITLQAAVAGLEPGELDVHATPDEILIQSERTHSEREGETVHCCEFRQGRLFREVHLPSKIDPQRSASCLASVS